MRRKHVVQTLLGLAAIYVASVAIAAPVGTAFTYQGQLKNAGSPANGNTDMAFSLWDAASGGAQQGSTLTFTGGTAVNVSSGLFTVQLDFGANPYTANAARWLEISVNGTTLAPRQLLTSTPFALNTRGVNVDGAGNLGIGTMTPGVPLEVRGNSNAIRFGDSAGVGNLIAGSSYVGVATGDNLTRMVVQQSNGNVGIGTTSPGVSLEVRGGSNAIRFGDSAGVGNLIASSSYVGLATGDNVTRMAIQQSTGNVGIGTSSPAVKLEIDGGSDAALTGGGYLQTGVSTGANIVMDNNEIMARNNSAASTLFLNNDGGNVIVDGNGTGNVGIGTTTPFANLQVGGTASVNMLTIGNGNPSSSGNTQLIMGVTSNSNGFCKIQSVQATGSAYGHLLLNGDGGNVGVGNHYVDVRLNVRDISGNSRIFNVEQTDGNNAFYIRSDGTTHCSSDFYCDNGGKHFRIDDPRDPANRFIVHNAIEGPGYFTHYQGSVVLGADGGAWVELPDYFDALNKDATYNLTCVGGYAPVYVANEVENSRFHVAGGTPGLKVSWQINASRKDPYAEDHPFAAVRDKQSDEKGTYCYPKGYGMPEDLAISRVHAKDRPAQQPANASSK